MEKNSQSKKTLSPAANELLRKIYYDPKQGYSSATELYKRVKASGDPAAKGITTVMVKEFLEKQTIKQIKKPKPRHYISISGDGHTYQADLMFLTESPRSNSGYGAILNIINTVSRKAYSYPLKGKTGPEVGSAFDKFFAEVPDKPTRFSTDSEASLAKALKRHGIEHHRVDSGDKTPMAVVERYNRTIRDKISTYLKATNTKRWLDVLPDLVHNYNTSVHSSIKKAPDSVTTEDIANIRIQNYNKSMPALEELMSFQPGDQVRVLKVKGIFDKGGSEFSRKVYTVVRLAGMRIILRGENGEELKRRYRNWELRKINDNPEDAPVADMPQQIPGGIITETPIVSDEAKLKKFIRLQRRAGLTVDSEGNPILPRTGR